MTRPTAVERFHARVKVMPNGCLEWTHDSDHHGYGRLSVGGKKVAAHRFAWELAHGPIPAGMYVLHRCDNPPCVNAYGCLFLGTQSENNADRDSKGRNAMSARTHCPKNHPYDEENTAISQGRRFCRECHRVADAAYRAKKRTA